MPRHMLFSNEMEFILTQYLDGKPEWEKRDVGVPIPNLEDPDGMNVTYFYNKAKNSVVIPSPLAVTDGEGLGAEPSYQATIAAIVRQLQTNNFNICSSLLGKSSGALHYTALYHAQNEDGKISIFDSKISDPKRFFNSSNAPSIWEMVWGYLTAPFKALGLWAFNISRRIDATFLDQPVDVYRLGTQGLFDGVSCGYHSTGAVIAMIAQIDQGECSTEHIASAIMDNKPHDQLAETLLNNQEKKEMPSVSPALRAIVSLPSTGLERDLQPQETDLNQHQGDTLSPNLVDPLISTNHSLLTI